jgi:hypothetical protein
MPNLQDNLESQLRSTFREIYSFADLSESTLPKRVIESAHLNIPYNLKSIESISQPVDSGEIAISQEVRVWSGYLYTPREIESFGNACKPRIRERYGVRRWR